MTERGLQEVVHTKNDIILRQYYTQANKKNYDAGREIFSAT
jgi:hypothetical protein